MSRIVRIEDHEPLRIEGKEKAVWICRCGLSEGWPYCDGSHKQTRTEEPGRTYAYWRDAPGAPIQRETIDDPPRADPRP